MPLYEYQCARCGRFEVIQRFADAALTTCPTCGGEVQKLLSAPAIQFKGSGWYVTDYARKSTGGGEAKSSEPTTSGDSKDASPSASPSTTSKDGSGSGKSTPSSK